MGAFTASIAHQINQPLASIVANSGAAARWLFAAVERIGENANRAGQVLRGLQAMFKKSNSKKSPLVLNTLIKDTLQLAPGAPPKHKISFTDELSHHPLKVVADPTQLQQVFINLILNATRRWIP